MRAHQLDADGVIINTIVVESLDFMPGLVDASIGGSIGDRVVNGAVVVAIPDSDVVKEERRAAIQVQIEAIESATLLNRGSRELEIVSCQDLAARQAATLTGTYPQLTVEQIAAQILAARPYYGKLLALDAQVSALRTERDSI